MNTNTTREDFKLKISSNYYISDREEPPECHMIETANDLLKYTEKPEYTLVHKDNDLVKLFHELKIAGYEPFIKYQVGTMTELKVNWKITKGFFGLIKNNHVYTINRDLKSINKNNEHQHHPRRLQA